MEGEHAERKIHSEGGKLEAIKHHFVSESMIQFKLRLDNRKKTGNNAAIVWFSTNDTKVSHWRSGPMPTALRHNAKCQKDAESCKFCISHIPKAHDISKPILSSLMCIFCNKYCKLSLHYVMINVDSFAHHNSHTKFQMLFQLMCVNISEKNL